MSKLILPILVSLIVATMVARVPSAIAEIEFRKQQGVTYVSGGLTPEEVKEMKKLAPRFPVQLYFASKGSDGPVTGVNVTVRDIQGTEILQATSEGPMFFVDVVGGRYTIDAEYAGETKSETKDQTGRRYLRIKYRFNE